MTNTAPSIEFLPLVYTVDEQETFLISPDIDIVDAELDALNGGLGNYSGATLVIQRAGGPDPDDIFGFDPAALVSAGITITGVPPVMTPDVGTSIDGEVFGHGGRIQIVFHSGATSELVDALIRAVTYQNASNDPPSSVTIRYTFTDGDPSDPLSTSEDVSVNLTPVNDAPALIGDLAAEVVEGGSVILTMADLGYTDPDNAPFQITYTVTGQVNGEIRVNGYAALSFTAENVATGIVEFVHDSSETTTASFTVSASDPDGPGVPASVTVDLSVTPANAEPQFFNLDASTRAYQEQGSPLVLAQSGAGLLTVYDGDFDTLNSGSGNYSGSELVVTITGSGGGDVLDFAAMTNVTRSGNSLLAGGNTIATIDETATSLSITFTDANGTIPTGALVNEVLQAITYANTLDNPIDNPSISIEFMDHDPALPAVALTGFIVEMQPVNDPPALTGDLTGIIGAGGIRVLTPADLFYTDPDNLPHEVTFEVTYTFGGEIRVGGVFATSFTAADIAAGLVAFVHDGSTGPTVEFGVTVDDFDPDNSPAAGGFVTLTVDTINDAPVLTSGGGSAIWTTNAGENATFRSLSFDDFAFDNYRLVSFNEAIGGTAVATVTAADPEEGLLTYSIVGGADQAFFVFDLATAQTFGSSSGTLFFKLPAGDRYAPNFEAPLDDDLDGIYEVDVEVSDGVNTVIQTVRVEIDDVNEAPRFLVDQPVLQLGAVAGTAAVETLTATDDDGTAVSYAISGGSEGALFAINPVSGALSFVTPPVFGDGGTYGQNLYEVFVTATSDVQTTEQRVLVRVTNPSNTAPVLDGFSTGGFAVTRGENQFSTPLQLVGSDNEGQGSGAGFLWEIVSAANGGAADGALFAINAVTGALSFIAPPDYDLPADAGGDNVYDVTVRLTDEYGVGLSDQEVLSITVGPPANDAPTITGLTISDIGPFETNFLENFPFTFSNIINATDPEGQTSGNGLVWEIVSVANGGAADADDFVIDPDTGGIRFAAQPDFEAPTDSDLDNTYTVTVKVTDNFGAGQSDQQTLTVHVLDIPDGGGGNTNPTIGNLDATRLVLPQSTAILLDGDVNIADAELDAGNGGNGDYQGATLTIQRQGGPNTADELGLHALALLAEGITITGANDEELSFNSNVIALSHDGEAFGFGGVLGINFQAGATSELVDAIVRAVTFRNASTSTADFTLQYFFNDGSGGSATDTILISATSGGSNAELITSFGGRASAITALIENATQVGTITATDPFDLPKAFSIDGGADGAMFSIDAATGVLTFNAAPDFEAPADADGDNVYEVVVRVETTGLAAGLYDSQVLSVAIADIPGLNLNGSSGHDRLVGSVEGDTLSGNNGNDTLVGGGSGDTLNGGEGFDVASFEDASGSVLADLALGAGGAPNLGTDTLISIEGLIGGGFADTLFGDGGINRLSGELGDDVLDGRAGADVLTGGGGRDTMTGGDGADDFDFNSLSEMGNSETTRDIITDFTVRSDDIDLRTIDASTRKGGNQNFKFIGTQKFHKVAGELHYKVIGGNTIVEGDTNGDGKADFQIELTGSLRLTAGDFIL